MKIIHRYILGQFLRMLFFALAGISALFLVIDFFERVDTFYSNEAALLSIGAFFLFKLPIIVSLMIPVAVLLATMLTIGILAKNSEITAMRAAGAPILWITAPLFAASFCISLLSLLLEETLVPYATRRVEEIYNIDIKAKDKTGGYSQSDLWWRSKNSFYSVDIFDSRNNTLLNLARFDVTPDFKVTRRINAERAKWLSPLLGWSMENVVDFSFDQDGTPKPTRHLSLPLPIPDRPEDFFNAKTDPDTMSYRELRRFMQKQREAGLSVLHHTADLYAKFSFPLVSFIVALVSLPFALKPARSGSMAASLLAGLTIGFSYYAVHSLSLAMGRAEIWPPFVAAWMANLLLLSVGIVLNIGSEAP